MTNPGRKPVIAGNWKMHKTKQEAKQLASAIASAVKGQSDLPTVVLCPTFTGLETVIAESAGSPVQVGAQNMDWREQGAFTGEIAPPMLVDLGVKYIIIGHSERRQFFGETNQTVNLRLKAAIKHNLVPIVCVGETIDERENNLTDAVIARQIAAALVDLTAEQIKGILIAYEPVWAIGTGKVCEAQEANRVAKLIRKTVANLHTMPNLADSIPILYGGSVKPSNIEEQLEQSDLDGALVGGASLNAEEFLALITATQKKLRLAPTKS